MRIAIVALFVLCQHSQQLNAQTPAVNPNDPGSVALTERNILKNTMVGITLSAEQTEAARKIIHKALADIFALPPEESNRRKKVLDMIHKRDAALEALLQSPADKAKFEANAAKMIRI